MFTLVSRDSLTERTLVRSIQLHFLSVGANSIEKETPLLGGDEGGLEGSGGRRNGRSGVARCELSFIFVGCEHVEMNNRSSMVMGNTYCIQSSSRRCSDGADDCSQAPQNMRERP